MEISEGKKVSSWKALMKVILLFALACSFFFHVEAKVEKNESELSSSLLCNFCELGVLLAEQYISVENVNETMILKDLQRFCSLFPQWFYQEVSISSPINLSVNLSSLIMDLK